MFSRIKLVSYIVLLFFAITQTSCFEIVEEVNLNDDGSGDFIFTINMSQSKLQINSMFLLDSVNGRPMPKKKDFEDAILTVKTELAKDSELAAIVVDENWEDYIFTVSGKFNNVDALNSAIKNINIALSKPRGYTAILADNFKYSNKVFERIYSYNLINEYKGLNEKDKAVFKNAKYTTIYRFKSPVKSLTNQNAMKSKSGKAVMLKVNVRELITNKKTIANTIELQ